MLHVAILFFLMQRFFSFRGDRAERPSFLDDDYVPGGDRRGVARQRRPRGGDY
jgi:receptor expression-enhancing protein 1/2/3/4